MFSKHRCFISLSILIIGSIVLSACAPAVTPATSEPVATQAPATPAPAKTQSETIKIGLFLPDKKMERYETKDKPFFEAKLKELCPNCELIVNIADSDVTEQQNAVEQAITNGVKVIAIMAVDTKAIAVVADNAKKAGIPVLAYSRLLENSDGVTVNVAFQLADIGIAQAKSLVEALDKKGLEKAKIAMINGSAADSNMARLRDGAMSVFQPLIDKGTLEIVKSIDTPDWDPTKAQSEMEQILTETGGKIDGVYVMNDGMASGVFAAFNSAGITPIPPITGLDCDLAAVQRIIVGQQYSSVYLPIKDMAEKSAEISYALATTGKVPEAMIMGTMNNGAIDVPSVFIPVVNVDKTNLQEKIIKTNFWTVDNICTAEYLEACKAAGLK